MYHRLCLRVPFLCLFIFSAIMGRKQDKDDVYVPVPVPEFGHSDSEINELLHGDAKLSTDIHPPGLEDSFDHEQNLLKGKAQQVLEEVQLNSVEPVPDPDIPDVVIQEDEPVPTTTEAPEIEMQEEVDVSESDVEEDMSEEESDVEDESSTLPTMGDELDLSSSIEKHDHPPKANPLLEHVHREHHKCNEAHDDAPTTDDHHTAVPSSESISLRTSIVMAIRHLGSYLVAFLPEYIQDTVLHVNDAVVFTGIIALTLVSICVPYFFIESFLSVRPLKKKVTDLNKTLWKVSTAFENQQEEYDHYKEKALAYDEDKNQVEQLETELDLVKQIELKLKTENRALKKRINKDVKVAEELEGLIGTTIVERDHITIERDKLRLIQVALQTKLGESLEQLETLRTEDVSRRMDIELLTHSNSNLELRCSALEKEIEELRTKLNTEIGQRRTLQTTNQTLIADNNSTAEQLLDLKSVLHKYEETVNNLNDEISFKENELAALKESLGEDSPLLDIAELTVKLNMAEGQASSLQARAESLSLENSNLSRDLEKANSDLGAVQFEKDQASTRLQVLEAYFKEKEEELRRMLDKHEAEKEIRGKDKDELVHLVEEKNDAVRDMSSRLEKMKEEFEETKLSHRNEIRTLETKSHETWLSLCQSERKTQEVRKEAELLRQKLTALARTKEADGHDALSSNGDLPSLFSHLDLDDIPLPLNDEQVMPSYFGLGDLEPPAPLDDEDDELFGIEGENRNDLRPPPLGQMSSNYPDQDDDEGFSVIRGRGVRSDLSDGSSSPLPPEGGEVESRENYMNGVSNTVPRRRQLPSTSSPYEHGVNL